MAQFPAFPLWTDAYLGDTTHLTTIEHGAYVLLLIAMWRSGKASLPADDRRLARLAKLEIRQWMRIKPTIMEFFDIDGNLITQGRLSDEWGYCRTASKKASDNAKARWLKYKGSPDAGALQSQSGGNAPTPTPTKKETRAAKAAEVPEKGVNGHDLQANPKARVFAYGKEVLGQTAGGLITKLIKVVGTVERAMAVLVAAAGAQDPREYVGAVVRGEDTSWSRMGWSCPR